MLLSWVNHGGLLAVRSRLSRSRLFGCSVGQASPMIGGFRRSARWYRSSVALVNERLRSSVSAGAVLELYKAHGARFNPVNLSTALHRLASLAASKQGGELQRQLVSDATASMSSMESRQVAVCCWAVARLRVVDPDELFEAAARHALPRIGSFKSRELGMLARAFADAGVEAPSLLNAAATAAADKLLLDDDSTPGSLAKTAWAFATTDGLASTSLFAAVAHKMLATNAASRLNAHELAQAAYALASREHEEEEVISEAMTALASAASEKAGEFSSEDLTRTAVVFARRSSQQQQDGPFLFEALAREANSRTWTPRLLGLTKGAFRSAGLEHLLSLKQRDPRTTTTPTPTKKEKRQQQQRLPAALPAAAPAAAAASEAPRLGGAAFITAAASAPPTAASVVAAVATASAAAAADVAPARGLAPRRPCSSGREQVSRCLLRLGVPHVFGHETNGLSLDMAIMPDSKLAVEFNGPSDYLAGIDKAERVLNGSSRARRRDLQRLGWTVVSVPHFAWPTTQQRQDAYLTDLLPNLITTRSRRRPPPGDDAAAAASSHDDHHHHHHPASSSSSSSSDDTRKQADVLDSKPY